MTLRYADASDNGYCLSLSPSGPDDPRNAFYAGGCAGPRGEAPTGTSSLAQEEAQAGATGRCSTGKSRTPPRSL